MYKRQDKRIVNGPNGITGEWGHNQIPSACIEGVQIKKTNLRAGEIENFVAGIGISKAFKNEFKKDLSAQKIFEMHRKLDLDAEKLIDKYKDQLAMSLATVVNIIDPDVFVFGGGVSNEINFLDEIKQKMK